MIYLLDTHILIWWHLDSPRLSVRHLTLLSAIEKDSETRVAVSIMSLWEIAKLVSAGRLHWHGSLDEWFKELGSRREIEILPLSSEIILDSTRLGDKFHRDPVDQLIAATARCHGLRLLTADEKIRKSGTVVCE